MERGDSRSAHEAFLKEVRLRQRESQEHTRRSDLAALLAMASHSASARLGFAGGSLNSQHIEATTQYLRSYSNLLDLVAIQLSQHLVKIHGPELDQRLTSETILIHIKRLAKEIFEKNNIWQETSKEIWSNLISRAIQDMQRDLGELVLESLDLAGFNELLFQYLFDQKSAVIINRINYLEGFYAREIAAKVVQNLDLTNQSLSALSTLLRLNDNTEQLKPASRDGLSRAGQILEETPSKLPTISNISTQLQPDLWQSDVKGLAYARYHSKHSQYDYLEYYITSSGDIEALPWEAAEQILNKFGLNTVKLQFLLAAYAEKQANPWESSFSLKASDIIAELGWDKKASLDLPTKRNQVASSAYALACLLVKIAWGEGQGKDTTGTSTPIGRMWEVLIHPHGQLDWRTGKIEKPEEVYLTVRPGLWTAYFLNQAGSRAKESLRQFGNLALNLLQLDPDDNELALRLAIYLTLDIRIRASDPHPYEYQVKPLLADVLPEDVTQHAQDSSESAYLFDRWNHALKLLSELGWHPEENGSQPDAEAAQTPIFYVKPYPRWLEPESSFRRPRGWVNCWLEQRLIIKPPIPEPERIATLIHSSSPQQQTLQLICTGNLTGTEVRAARQARKLTQSELAGLLQVHQSLIARIESGDRAITPTLEASLRQILGLEQDQGYTY